MIPEDADRCTETKEVLPNTFPARRCFEKKDHDGRCRFQMNRVEINYFTRLLEGPQEDLVAYLKGEK